MGYAWRMGVFFDGRGLTGWASVLRAEDEASSMEGVYPLLPDRSGITTNDGVVLENGDGIELGKVRDGASSTERAHTVAVERRVIR